MESAGSEKEVVEEIMTLPTFVAEETFRLHPGDTALLDRICESTLAVLDVKAGIIEEIILTCTDEMQASFFLSCTGYYRQSIGCLRSILELVTIASRYYILGDEVGFRKWQDGIEDGMSFNVCCMDFLSNPRIREKEKALREIAEVNLFEQANSGSNYPGGLARQLYKELSKYQHSSPGHTNGDLWQSNGPVFDEIAHYKSKRLFHETCAMTFLVAKIARPDLIIPEGVDFLFNGKFVELTPGLRRAYMVYLSP